MESGINRSFLWPFQGKLRPTATQALTCDVTAWTAGDTAGAALRGGLTAASSLLSGKHHIMSEWTGPLKASVTGRGAASLSSKARVGELLKSMSFASTPLQPVCASTAPALEKDALKDMLLLAPEP